MIVHFRFSDGVAKQAGLLESLLKRQGVRVVARPLGEPSPPGDPDLLLMGVSRDYPELDPEARGTSRLCLVRGDDANDTSLHRERILELAGAELQGPDRAPLTGVLGDQEHPADGQVEREVTHGERLALEGDQHRDRRAERAIDTRLFDRGHGFNIEPGRARARTAKRP